MGNVSGAADDVVGMNYKEISEVANEMLCQMLNAERAKDGEKLDEVMQRVVKYAIVGIMAERLLTE